MEKSVFHFPGRRKFLIETIKQLRASLIQLFSLSLFLDCSMKSTAFLTIIMTINWIFEIISFYAEASSTLFDIVNALQGVLIFLMFVCLPRPMKLIQEWWKDRGSFEVLPDESNSAKSPNEGDIQMTSFSKK